jgi:hypothetical protein
MLPMRWNQRTRAGQAGPVLRCPERPPRPGAPRQYQHSRARTASRHVLCLLRSGALCAWRCGGGCSPFRPAAPSGSGRSSNTSQSAPRKTHGDLSTKPGYECGVIRGGRMGSNHLSCVVGRAKVQGMLMGTHQPDRGESKDMRAHDSILTRLGRRPAASCRFDYVCS